MLAAGLEHNGPPSVLPTLSFFVSPAVHPPGLCDQPKTCPAFLGDRAPGGGREGVIGGLPGRGFGEAGLEGYGALGVFLRTYLREVGGLGLTDAGRRFAARLSQGPGKKVANIIIFLLECSDYKNKTCFL